MIETATIHDEVTTTPVEGSIDTSEDLEVTDIVIDLAERSGQICAGPDDEDLSMHAAVGDLALVLHDVRQSDAKKTEAATKAFEKSMRTMLMQNFVGDKLMTPEATALITDRTKKFNDLLAANISALDSELPELDIKQSPDRINALIDTGPKDE